MQDRFVNVRILDNFYQTSSFFPMPVVLISTVSETGQTNLGPYSLCFPYIVAGEHSMLLVSREDSNTSLNIQRTGVCAINFIPDKKKYMRNCVVLGFPGETTEEKMLPTAFPLRRDIVRKTSHAQVVSPNASLASLRSARRVVVVNRACPQPFSVSPW